MNHCTSHETTLALYVAGEIGESRLGPLLTHCRDCAECRQLLELHRDLVNLSARAPEPDDARFEALHSRVLRELSPSLRSPAVTRRPTPLHYALAIAATIAIFVGGIATGRAGLSTASTAENVALNTRILSAISAEAASNQTLSDIEDSRFTLSNVSFRRLPAGQVALGFNVITHVELVESTQSELVREALIHSLLNSSNTGARLKAISYAAGAMQPKVRQALIFALRHDKSLAVRLQALTILSDEIAEPDVEAAVLATLREDPSVQVRLLAIDFLATHQVSRELIRKLLQQDPQPGDEALRVRLAEYES